MSAGGQVVIHDVSVVDDENGKRHLIDKVQSRALRGERAFPGVGENGELPVGLKHSVFDRAKIAVALCAKLLIEFVHREPVFCHVLLDDLPVTNNDCRFSADYGAEADGFQIEEAQQHGEAQECYDGQQPVDKRNSVVLHGYGGKVGDRKCQHQFAGLQFTDLALSQQSKTDHKNNIQDQCTKKRGYHEYTSLLLEYLRNERRVYEP